ncbi:hypothetical protein MMC28_009183 [Mycoblastus sanguinarius]|nr:hypothetical protein [Mycoblastus sanguinarius]
MAMKTYHGIILLEQWTEAEKKYAAVTGGKVSGDSSFAKLRTIDAPEKEVMGAEGRFKIVRIGPGAEFSD